MNPHELRQLIAQKEGLKLDFKREYKFDAPNQKVRNGQRDEFIKDVLALTNGNVGVADQPAYLIIGVGDELRADGSRDLFDVRGLEHTARSILNSLKSGLAVCHPPLPDSVCEIVELDGKEIVAITIPPSPHLHETARTLQVIDASGKLTRYPETTVFVRRSEGTYPASEAERRAMVAEKKAGERPRFQPDAVEVHRTALARKRRYAHWGDASSDEYYVREKGMRLPLFASPYGDLTGALTDLLDTIRSHHRLLVLGEPGVGKTVALERIVWETATALESTVPVYVPLIHYDDHLLDSVRVALNETGILQLQNSRDVEAFLHQYRCLLLFDGLNEVPGNRRECLQAELGKFLHAFSVHPCVITSRSQDKLWRRFHSREAVEDAVVVQRISDGQVREYLIAHLGQQMGQELYDRMNEALHGLSRTPLFLWMIKEAGLSGEELPGNRGQLFDRFIEQVLKREQKHPELVTVPQSAKKRALGHLAFTLQLEHRLTCDRRTAEVIIENAGIQDGDAIVRESLLNGLLRGEHKVHFLHQAVHEYFVALQLNEVSAVDASRRGWERITVGLRRAMRLERGFREWAKDEWWTESIVQLAGLIDNPDWLTRTILPVNPWLAYWCAIEGRAVTEATLQRIEAKTVARLESASVEERLRVVRELARMENPRTIEHLLTALSDGSSVVVTVASKTLARLGQPAVVPLHWILKSDHEGARRAAIRTLGAIWQFPEIVELGDENAEIREAAAEMIGRLGDLRAVEPLVTALHDSDTEVRRIAAEALGNLGDSRAVEPLLAVLKYSYAEYPADSALKRSIAMALRRLGASSEDPLLIALQDIDETVRRRAMLALGQMWQIPEVVGLADGGAEVRRRAAVSLADLGDGRVVEPLLAALRDGDEQVRRNATVSLGRIWAMPDLVALGDDNEWARQRTALTLGKLGDKRATQPLLAALRDSDQKVRRYAARALRQLGEQAEVSLVAMLRDENRQVRRDAALALARVGGELALDALTTALNDDERYVRETALEALAKLGSPAVKPLAIAFESSDPELRLGAAEALRRIGTIEALTLLHGHDEPKH
jgi:HEAT repeat protein